ncbi:MAG: penicillin acylase family protein [Gemmatimonadales bacterium]
MLIVPRARRRVSIARPLAAGLILTALLWVGARGAGLLPPLAPLLDPWRGAWALAAPGPRSAVDTILGLRASVHVLFDDRSVPHIFAADQPDALRALGYITARDRLFQLDLQARAGGGTLTELLGARALDLDREARGLGMARAAERLTEALPDTGNERAGLSAYADGVNAYLDAMPERALPLEYRLLGRRPARWSPARTIQVLLRMDYVLTRNSTELERLAAAGAVGDAAASALFPAHSPIQEPIQPAAGDPRRLPFAIPPPGAPDSSARALSRAFSAAPRQDLGSNNWAVAPARTRARAALLAGDPHLDLTLPSIWYEAHLAVPDTLDVYGVTIAGLPGILIGFTRNVAWSFTNVEADLMDRWLETVDDSIHPRRYRLDGRWVPLELRHEIYLGPRGDTLAIDTLRFTHRGPMQRVAGRWISLRWTALEDEVQIGALQRAARARTAGEWLSAMASYRTPPQNMLVADRSGTIAIRSTGRFPIRGSDGRGDHLLDGSTRATDWKGDWPVAEEPQAISPAQGFLASANQEPQDPHDQRRYLGSDWPVPWRALRINQLLRSESAATPDEMRRWQTDPGSPRADFLVPYFLSAAETHSADTALAHARKLLAAWDRRYTLENEGAVLFEDALRSLGERLWEELPSDVRPGTGVLLALLEDPTNLWWDDRRTVGRVERRDDILADALRQGYDQAVSDYGPPEQGGWRWSAAHRVDVWHLLHLAGLSRLGLAVPGGPSTLSPSSVSGGGEGASWRMVVELGTEVHGWGTYPGGQSGNPASSAYADRLGQWTRGELAPLRFPRRPADLVPTAELLLRPRTP